MTTLSDIEKLAEENCDRAIRSATALLKSSNGFSTDLVEVMVNSIIIAAMMEIASMQMKIVEEGK